MGWRDWGMTTFTKAEDKPQGMTTTTGRPEEVPPGLPVDMPNRGPSPGKERKEPPLRDSGKCKRLIINLI